MPPMIGQITLFPYNWAPQGWRLCDGAVLPISENKKLFQVIGNHYGGDGKTTFAVPDLREAAPQFCHYCIALVGTESTNIYQGIVGETLLLPKSIQPPGNLVECTGGTFTRDQFPQLGRYIGRRFGGDGENTFGLPNLSGKFPASGYHYKLAVSGDPPEDRPLNREIFWGELILLPFDQAFFDPHSGSENLSLCDGRRLAIYQNTALFSLLGSMFGGDGKNTFELPNLRGVPVANYNYYISRGGTFPPRAQ